MKHLQNLISNATAIIDVRKALIEHGWIAYRDPDRETRGFWLKKPNGDGFAYIGVFLVSDGGVSVNLNTMEEYEEIKPVASTDAILSKIEEFLRKREIADHI